MLRYLFIADVAIAILGASMMIGVGVSALLLGVHLDTAPQYRDQVWILLELTAIYAFATAAATLSGWALHRRKGWHWVAQAVLLLASLASYFISLRSLSAS